MGSTEYPRLPIPSMVIPYMVLSMRDKMPNSLPMRSANKANMRIKATFPMEFLSFVQWILCSTQHIFVVYKIHSPLHIHSPKCTEKTVFSSHWPHNLLYFVVFSHCKFYFGNEKCVTISVNSLRKIEISTFVENKWRIEKGRCSSGVIWAFNTTNRKGRNMLYNKNPCRCNQYTTEFNTKEQKKIKISFVVWILCNEKSISDACERKTYLENSENKNRAAKCIYIDVRRSFLRHFPSFS